LNQPPHVVERLLTELGADHLLLLWAKIVDYALAVRPQILKLGEKFLADETSENPNHSVGFKRRYEFFSYSGEHDFICETCCKSIE
jgi:hypothetical protein